MMANGRTMEYHARIACVGCGDSEGAVGTSEVTAWCSAKWRAKLIKGFRFDEVDGDLCGACYRTIENEMATAEGRR